MNPRCRWSAALLVVSAVSVAQPAEERPPQEPAPEFPSASLRLGAGVAPIVGFSGRSYFLNQVHLLNQGGWVNIDAAPGVHLSRLFTLELAVSMLIPIQDAWGFPRARVALTPTVRLDASWFYARAGAQFMFGEGVKYGGLVAVGVNIWKLYVGVVGLVTSDFLGGVGLELGVHFDKLLRK